MSDEEEREWKYELSDLPPLEGEEDVEMRIETEDGEGSGGNVVGSLGHDREIVPESPRADNAAFLLLGALLTAGIAAGSVWGLPRIGGVHPLTLLLVGTLAAMVAYQVFGDDGEDANGNGD